MIDYAAIRDAIRQKQGAKKRKVVAQEMGVCESSLSKFMNGVGEISLESFARICDWLDCSMDRFRVPAREVLTEADVRRVVGEMLAKI